MTASQTPRTPPRTNGAGTELPPLPRLPAALPRSGVSRDARAALRQLLDDHARALTAAFRQGASAELLAHARADVVSTVCGHVWSACVGETGDAALFAIGGFGHGVLFPFSDIDLLVLHDADPEPSLMRALEAFFGCLWDVGLKPDRPCARSRNAASSRRRT